MIKVVPGDRMPRQNDIARKRAAYERSEELRKGHAHLFPADFYPDKVLEEAREERSMRQS